MTAPDPTILSRFDAGETPVQIAKATGVKSARVYAILRKHRPDRPRAARSRTSTKPEQMLALHAEGVAVERIAEILEVSKAYVYGQIQKAKDQANAS